jgi:hypothetical protein
MDPLSRSLERESHVADTTGLPRNFVSVRDVSPGISTAKALCAPRLPRRSTAQALKRWTSRLYYLTVALSASADFNVHML